MLIPLMIFCCACTAGSTVIVGRLGAWSYPTLLASGFTIVAVALGSTMTFWEEPDTATEIVILLLIGMGIGVIGQTTFLAAQASCDSKGNATAICCYDY